MDNCSLKAITMTLLLLPLLLTSFARKNLITITPLFQKLIDETQNNLHQLTTHMSTLILWHSRFSENENEAVEAHIPRHRDSKARKPRHRDYKTKKLRH